MESESTINHMRVEVKKNGEKGEGLIQWTPVTKIKCWADELGLDYKDIDIQLERIIYEVNTKVKKDIQWNDNGYTPKMSFAQFICSTEDVEKREEIFLYCYEQPGELPQPKRGKQAEKWRDILEVLNGK